MSGRGRCWRDENKETFHATIDAAAEQLRVQPLAVEKDYWVCELLRELTTHHPGELVFKGGTSLEKLRIIRRFSEDLDLLVVGQYGSGKAAERALKAMIATAQSVTGLTAIKNKSGGNPGTYHRSAYIPFPARSTANVTGIADQDQVLVELGQAGGPNPHDTYEVTSLLARQLANANMAIDNWSDLAPFNVPILHPGRTLLEKLLRVNTFAHNPNAMEGPHGWLRIGRQLYDIYQLLGDSRVLELLADKHTVTAIMNDAATVSHSLGRADTPPAQGGFAASPIFDSSWEHASRLEAEHQQAMQDLYYGNEDPPTYNDVLTRVHSMADLLT